MVVIISNYFQLSSNVLPINEKRLKDKSLANQSRFHPYPLVHGIRKGELHQRDSKIHYGEEEEE